MKAFKKLKLTLFTILSGIGIIFIIQGCMIGNVGYSFKGTSIPPEAFTFYIDNIDNQTGAAPPALPQTFMDALIQKIRNESRLKYDDENPHLEFAGALTSYLVRAEAPQGDAAAFNRLTVTFRIEYINNLKEDDTWNKNFSHFADFETNDNLIDVQDALIEEILEEIVEKIFNEAFTNW